MDSDLSAERGILRWNAVRAEGREHRVEAPPVDAPLPVRLRGDRRCGIVEAEKQSEPAVVIDPRDAIRSARRRLVAAQVRIGCTVAADRDVAHARNEAIVRRKDAHAERAGVDEDPGRALRGGSGTRNAREQGGEEQCAGETQRPAARRMRSARARLLRAARGVALLALGLAIVPASAASFPLPADGSNIVGRVRVVRLDDARNTLLDIARHYDLGYNEITAANPGVSLWLPGAGTRIVVPTEFILPPRPWVGIVVDIPRRRLYYFPPPARGESARVVTFPIGIAQPGWPTPLGETRIIAKFKDPSWIVPKNILEEHREAGEPDYPKYFPPGPDNPMGMLAMETGFSEVFIHGTNHPWGVGMRVSHGCLHLYPEDAAYLFARLRVGTPVRVIDAPVLVGERGGTLYLSASPPVGDYASAESVLTRAVAAVTRYRSEHALAGKVSWNGVIRIAQAHRIVPAPVSVGAPGLATQIAALQPEAYAVAPYGADANDAEAPARR